MGIVGDRFVLFDGSGETIRVTHKADVRRLCAHGALRHAVSLVDHKPGLNDMACAARIGPRWPARGL